MWQSAAGVRLPSSPALDVPGARAVWNAAPKPLAPALLAASGLHVLLLALLLLAVRTYRLPNSIDPAAVEMVFAPPAREPARPEAVSTPADVPAPRFEIAAPSPEALAAAPTPDPAPVPNIATPLANSAPPSPLPQVEPARSLTRAKPPPRAVLVPRASTAQPTLRIPPSQPASEAQPSAGEVAPTSPARPAPIQPPAPISSGYRDALIGWLQTHKTYPVAARMAGTEGRVLVHFTSSRDGRVIEVSLTQSSGSGALDEAAMTLLRGAHLPAFPASMLQDAVSVTLPISYRLD